MNDRFLRQLDILKNEKTEIPIFVIGAGSIGSFTSLCLAKMGMKNLYVFDFDKIEEHNFPNQFFREKDLSLSKVEALRNIVKEFTGTNVKSVNLKYERQPLKGIVISAVDNMKMRQQIYKNCLKNKDVEFLIDPRSGAEFIRLYSVNLKSEVEKKFYEKFFYSDEQSERLPCTAANIIYTVLFISSMICNQIKRYLMQEAYKREIIFDMASLFLLCQ